jgi:predicted TIM-barrel enzyme
MKKLARSIRSDVLVLTHGGPLENPADVAAVMHSTGTQGFIGASTMERLPTEVAIQNTVQGFADLKLTEE